MTAVSTGKPPILSETFCQCSACGESFTGIEAFDNHRVGQHRVEGDRRCKVPSPGSNWYFDLVSYHHGTYWRINREKKRAYIEGLVDEI